MNETPENSCVAGSTPAWATIGNEI